MEGGGTEMLTRQNVKVKGRLYLLIIKSNVHFNSKTLICFYYWSYIGDYNIISEYALNTPVHLLCNKQSSGDLIGGYVFVCPCFFIRIDIKQREQRPNRNGVCIGQRDSEASNWYVKKFLTSFNFIMNLPRGKKVLSVY